MKKVGIIGCGWLGFPLAQQLVSMNYQVKGTTTSVSKFQLFEENSIQPLVFCLGEELSPDFFESLDVLIICFPISSKHSKETYADFCEQLHQKKAPSTKVIFTSSISVYQQNQGVATESEGLIDALSINYFVEQEFQRSFQEQLTILRLGGLFNEERHPVYHLSGRKDLENGNSPVNLVHRNDVIYMLLKVLELQKFGELFNCVFPAHPSKSAYYTQKANEFQLEPPTFKANENTIHKIVSSQKAMDVLAFEFNYPI